MRRLFTALLVFLLTAACARAAVDFKQPLDLKFTAIDGRTFDLSQMRGKVVLIDFWATWSPPCMSIRSHVIDLYKKSHARGLEVVGISADSDIGALWRVVKKDDMPWPEYFDNGGDKPLFLKLGVDSFPTTWLVDRKGFVVNRNFRDLWGHGAGMHDHISPSALARVDDAIARQLKAP